jgi:hypothetical protein
VRYNLGHLRVKPRDLGFGHSLIPRVKAASGGRLATVDPEDSNGMNTEGVGPKAHDEVLSNL